VLVKHPEETLKEGGGVASQKLGGKGSSGCQWGGRSVNPKESKGVLEGKRLGVGGNQQKVEKKKGKEKKKRNFWKKTHLKTKVVNQDHSSVGRGGGVNSCAKTFMGRTILPRLLLQGKMLSIFIHTQEKKTQDLSVHGQKSGKKKGQRK